MEPRARGAAARRGKVKVRRDETRDARRATRATPRGDLYGVDPTADGGRRRRTRRRDARSSRGDARAKDAPRTRPSRANAANRRAREGDRRREGVEFEGLDSSR
jgi:hypothetical protein